MPNRAAAQARPELSVVLRIRDCEETIGHVVRAIHAHLRELRVAFEIVAVNDGSGDNSFSILRLLAASMPELRLFPNRLMGRALVRGVSESRGGMVLLLDADRPAPLGPLGWALGRLASGREAVIVRGRYIVARRLLALPVVVRTFGRGETFERAFERRAIELGVDVLGTPPRRKPAGLLAPVLRLLAA